METIFYIGSNKNDAEEKENELRSYFNSNTEVRSFTTPEEAYEKLEKYEPSIVVSNTSQRV